LTTSQAAPPPFWRAIGLTFETCVRNVRACLMLSATYALFVGLAGAIGRSASLNVDPTHIAGGELIAVGAAVVAAVITLFLVAIFVYPPTIGALCIVGSAAVEEDEIDPAGVFRRTIDRALDAVGAGVLTLLIVAGPLLVLGVVGAAVGLVVSPTVAFTVVAFPLLLLFVPSLYVFIRLSLAIPVVMREGLGPIDALRRSWELVHGAWWWVFGVYVVVGLVAGLINGIVTSLGGATGGVGGFLASAILSTVGAAAATSLIGVASGVVFSGRALPHVATEPPVVTAPEEPAEPAEP
jgi:hypothetical protein